MGANMVKCLSKQSTPPAPAASALLVLGDDDLLREILVRLGFPASLVRASAVCRRWFRIASDAAFLRRFRDLHPPRLLGFYVYPTFPSCLISTGEAPQFVPMLPRNPELAAVLRRGSFSLDAYEDMSMGIVNCRNGSVLINFLHPDGRVTREVHQPLQPARAMVMIPAPPLLLGHDTVHAVGEIICKEDDDGLSYFWLLVEFSVEGNATGFIHKLQGGVWSMHTSATAELPELPLRTSNVQIVLVDDRIYMANIMSSILVLDLTSSCFFTIELPDEVSFNDGRVVLSRSSDSGVYLVHLKDLKLCIWFHRGINGSARGWVLIDTICLRDACASLRMPTCNTAISINVVGDNAEFVFLDIGKYILHLDVKSRVLRMVHKMPGQTETARRILPFMMIWPPVFPLLKELSCKGQKDMD